MKNQTKVLTCVTIVLLCVGSWAPAAEFLHFSNLFNGKDLSGWVNVNTADDTWSVRDGMLVCSGHPIGVMRTEKQYENFILHIEWRHMEAGGNSGVFVWSEGTVPKGRRLPKGVEVQMLELDWVNLHKHKDGTLPPIAYVHGEVFGAGGLKTVPDNPRGSRSKSIENRCKEKGLWNTYVVVCVDGVIKLSVNGKFVNGISKAAIKKGYICLESEGAEIHFRNIRIMELPPGITGPESTAGRGVGDPNEILLKPIPDKIVVLTFDDACLSHATFVGPLLKKYGFGGTFYITEFAETFTDKTLYMTWEQIKSLDDMGFEVGNHTLLHWGPKNPQEFTRQTAAIEDHCLINKIAKPTTFCWPFCHVEWDKLPILIQRGYLFARGGHNRPYKPTVDNPFDTPAFQIDVNTEKNNKDVFYNAVKQATPGQIVILLFHGVPDLEHPTVGTDPARFEEYLKYLKDNKYSVISMRDMAKYIDPVKAAKQLAN